MTRDNDDRNYAVGYGKPPKNTQFKKGQSGNPKGRPRGAKNCSTILSEQLYRKITVTENGKRKTITVLEAIFKRMSNSALEGDRGAWATLIKLFPMMEADNPAGDEVTDALEVDETDEAILRQFIKISGSELLNMTAPDKAEDGEA